MRRDPRALETALADLQSRHLARERATVESFTEAHDASGVIADGRSLVNFSSNDYLGLARHPLLIEALQASAARNGVGATASDLVTGHGLEHARLEEEIAAFTGRERALLFSSGYLANLAAIGVLAGRGDLVLLDRLNHASLIDGARLCGARFRRFTHADAAAAARLLVPHEGATLLATDGVFSMDGDIAPLPALATSCAAHDAWLVVDDAHGLGVLGASGRGSLEHFGLDARQVPVLVGTFGKAFGTSGAFVAGDHALVELFVQKARSHIYTTAMPQPLAAATRAALQLSQRESWRRERVLALAARFRAAAAALDLSVLPSSTPIQPVMVGTANAALEASRRLRDAGFWVAAIRPPTVPEGAARLRVALSAAHTEAQVDALVDALARSLRPA